MRGLRCRTSPARGSSLPRSHASGAVAARLGSAFIRISEEINRLNGPLSGRRERASSSSLGQRRGSNWKNESFRVGGTDQSAIETCSRGLSAPVEPKESDEQTKEMRVNQLLVPPASISSARSSRLTPFYRADLSLSAMSDHEAAPPSGVESEQSPAPAPEQAQQPELPGPGAFLKSVVGQRVVVRLNSGVDYRGELASLGFI